MPLSPGDKFGPYELIVPIGKGGMGEVWKARDARVGRDVAIKVSAARFSERFEREAKAIGGALNHPNVCTLYDVGPNYLVMEFIEGAPLKGPLPLDQALRYAVQICDALDAAHKKGITHRDLKPANILLTKAGVKLLDFGLAKIRPTVKPDDATMTMSLTAEGQILGTLVYMSPEQLQGKEADARSDIFAFGLALYQLLTGKRAFAGSSTASVTAAILERPAPSVADIAPAALDRVLRKCLAKDPDDRWQSARDLKDELEWIAQAEPVETPAKRLWLWRGVALLAVITLSLGGWMFWSKTQPPAQMTRFEVPLPEKVTFGQYVSLSPDGRKLVFNATGEQAVVARLEGAPSVKLLMMPFGSGSPVRRMVALGLLAPTPALLAQAPRRPRGVYAVVNVEDFVFNGGPYAATHMGGALLGPASLYPGLTTPAKSSEIIVLCQWIRAHVGPGGQWSGIAIGTLSPLPAIKTGGITATYNGLSTQVGTLITVQP